MSKPEDQNIEGEFPDQNAAAEHLSEDHRQYLISRHGTLKLEPLPHMDDADPLNWPKRKKVVNLALVSFHSMMSTFTAAAIQCAFVDIAADLGVSVQQASYLVSIVIVILGVAPLLWRPLSHAYGRRPIFLLSLICSLIGNVGCAVSRSYGTMGLCRAITAFFICPAVAIGSAVVSESFFREERARYMGVWTTMVTLGVPFGAFIFGFVALRVGYRWIYWILAITNGVQFILYLFFGPETRYVSANRVPQASSFRQEYLTFRRIDPAPLLWFDFVHPLTLAARLNVTIPAISYAMIFLWGSVMTTFEMPQIYPEKFGFNTEQVGLQMISIIIGTLIGEQFGGVASDKWMERHERKGKVNDAEHRLWLGYPGHLLTICGTVVFMVQVANASSTWNITPTVGAGIAAAGNQLVTTIMITYAVDCYPKDAAAVGVFITLVRQVWGFIGPFWIPDMIDGVGLVKSAGIATAMMVGVSMMPALILQWRGLSWRKVGEQH